MPHIYVKPSPGGRVRMPERNFIPMDAAGAWVPRIDYYERLLIGGDVIECEPPASAEEASAGQARAQSAAEDSAVEVSPVSPETPAADKSPRSPKEK
jgi:hypothetical protein